MKKIFRAAACAAMAMLSIACAKTEQENPGENADGTIKVSIDGIIGDYAPQDGTKSEVQTVARVVWSNGDVVHVFDGARYVGYLTADVTETEGLYAKLSGTIQTPSGSLLTLVHSPQLPTATAPSLDGNKLFLDLSNQAGSEVPFLVYGTMPSPASASISSEVVRFSLATSVYKVSCTGLPESGDIIRAQIDNVNTVCTLTLSGNSEPVVGGEKPGKITRSGKGSFQAKDERAFLNFAVVKTEGRDRKLSIRKTVGVYSASFDNKSFDAAKSYNTIAVVKNAYPDGAVPGIFSIDGKRYCFAKGNLWYGKKDGASEATFNFEDSQLDYPSAWDANHVSHFYWSRSAEVARAATYSDPQVSADDALFTENPDFMANGQKGMWHTLAQMDWLNISWSLQGGSSKYILAVITDSKGSAHRGIIILPDEFFNPLDRQLGQTYTLEEFLKIQAEGAVFLPNAGLRTGSALSGGRAEYLTSTPASRAEWAYYFYYTGEEGASDTTVNITQRDRGSMGCSLRLVTEMQ